MKTNYDRDVKLSFRSDGHLITVRGNKTEGVVVSVKEVDKGHGPGETSGPYVRFELDSEGFSNFAGALIESVGAAGWPRWDKAGVGKLLQACDTGEKTTAAAKTGEGRPETECEQWRRQVGGHDPH